MELRVRYKVCVHEIELEFGVLVFEEGRNREPGENPRSKDDNQQQTQPTNDAGPGRV